MRCEARPRSEARRADVYVERAPEAATKQIAKRVSPEYISWDGVASSSLCVAQNQQQYITPDKDRTQAFQKFYETIIFSFVNNG